MLKLVPFAAAALLATAALAADKAAAPAEAPKAQAAGEKTAVIPVKGMSCGGCVNRVNTSLQKVEGVRSVSTDLEKNQTTVVFDPAKVKPEALAKAVDEAGYEAGKPSVK